jgi:hypothetical protein
MDADVAFAFPHQLNTMLGLTGEANNPPTSPLSNQPGLDTQKNVPQPTNETGGSHMKSHHWVIIIVVALLALFGWWYFYSA